MVVDEFKKRWNDGPCYRKTSWDAQKFEGTRSGVLVKCHLSFISYYFGLGSKALVFDVVARYFGLEDPHLRPKTKMTTDK
jgi:hypothetical protein